MEHDQKPNGPGDTSLEDYREAIDACRPSRFDPAGRDWELPEVAPLAEEISRNPQLRGWRSRVAALDTAIAAAIEATPAPAGLADRLMAKLQQAAAEAAARNGGAMPAVLVESECEAPRTIAAARQPRQWIRNRRWWLSAAAAAVAAACLFGWWSLQPSGSLDYEQLLAQANAFDQAWAPGNWKSLRVSLPHRWYAIPNAVSTRAAAGWQKVRGFVGRDGVAYDLVAVTGAKGVLYVVPLRAGGAKAIAGLAVAPGKPHTTAGRATSAWTDGERLYVLVVRGGESDYLSLIRQQSMI